MTHKPCYKTHAESIMGMIIITLLVNLIQSDQVFSQRRSRDKISRSEDSADLPKQRTPLPASKLDLEKIPYKIVYESYRETQGKSNWEICIINADGSEKTNLTNTPDIDEFYPHASSDGRKICYVADIGEGENKSRNVYYMNIDGTGRIKVADNARQPCWSSDGKSIAYLKGEYSRYSSRSWSNRGLEIYNLETKRKRQHPNENLRLLFNLCWSPDGKWFTATSRSRGRSGSNIAFKADDVETMSLSIQGCRPDISPDGKRLAWGRSDHDLRIGTLDLNSIDNNVKDQKSIVACQRDYKIYHVDWSPDSKYLTFSYGSSRGGQYVGRKAEGWNICICDLTTGKWTQITTDGNHNKEPDWVPVGL